MKKLAKFDLSIVLLFLSIILGMYFCQNMVLFEDDPRRFLEYSEFLPLFLITLVPSIAYVLVKIKRKERYTKFDIIIGFVFLSVLGINTYTVLTLPDGISSYGIDQEILNGITFDYSKSEKVFSICYCIISLITGYILLCELPKKIRTQKSLSIYYIFNMVICAGFMIYSYITQTDEYLATLKAFDYTHIMISFIETCNCAVWLFYTMYTCFYLNNRKPCFIWYVLALFFYINIYFQKSKINMFMGAVLFVVYGLYRLVYTFKNHKKRNIVISSILFLLIAGLTTCFIYFKANENTIFYKLINQYRIFTDAANSTTKSREIIWTNTIAIFNTSNWTHGTGFSIFNKLVRLYCPTTDLPHNAFLEYIGLGGVPLLVLMMGLYFYFFVVIFKIRKKNPSLFVLSLTTNILYLLHMVFDSNTPFLMSSTPIIDVLFIAFVLFIPSYREYYHLNYSEDNQQVIKCNQQSLELKQSPYRLLKIFLFILGLLFSLSIVYIKQNSNPLSSSSTFIVISCLLVVSIVVSIIQFSKEELKIGSFFVQILLPYSLAIFVSILSTYHLTIYLPSSNPFYQLLIYIYDVSIYFLFFIIAPGKQSICRPLINLNEKLNCIMLKIEAKNIEKELKSNEHN